jgi:hypothetical protein|uniref:NrS-1 polymerase-like helicase domain-containing protein n=1 Tax=viral metagenome TaxID=1070528 RepID=A0A6C0IX97_9ZZZZ
MTTQWNKKINYAIENQWPIDEDTGELEDDDSEYSRDSVRRRNAFREDMKNLRNTIDVIPVVEAGTRSDDDEEEVIPSSFVAPGVVCPLPSSIGDISLERRKTSPHDNSTFVFMDTVNSELYTVEWCTNALARAKHKWCPYVENDSNVPVAPPIAFACSRFGLSWDGVGEVPLGINTQDLMSRYIKEMSAIYELQSRACQSNMFHGMFEADSMRILHIIYISYNMLVLAIQQRNAFQSVWSSPDDPTVFCLKPVCANDREFTPFQQAYWYLMRKLYELGYRRYKKKLLYSRVINPDNVFTHTFKFEVEIEDFVYKMITPYDQAEIWKGMTSQGVHFSSLIDYLGSVNDPHLPVLQKDRYVHSFRNGLYFVKHDVFVPFQQAKIPNDCIACKYHPILFNDYDKFRGVDFEGVTDETSPLGRPSIVDTAYDIPTPLFDKIMLDQNFPYQVRVWLYVMMGRMLYWARDEDNWQVWMFHFGTANTGKSTMCQIMQQYFFERHDIGIISNQFEKMFGLWGLRESLAVFCSEVGEDFSMDRTDLQSMITAETVTIRRKNLMSDNSFDWVVPGMFGGNYIPNWKDPQGAMARRLLIWYYLNAVKVDNTLFKRMEQESGNIILKCNRFYRAALIHVGRQELWSVLPRYFWQQRTMLQSETSPIHGFFSSDEVQIVKKPTGEIDESVYIPLTTLAKIFNEWKKQSNKGVVKWAKDTYQKALSDMGLPMPIKKRLPYPRDHTQTTQQMFVMGIDTTAEIQRLENVVEKLPVVSMRLDE